MDTRRTKIETMLDAEPDDVFLNYGLAIELMRDGDHNEAVLQFDRVLAIDADYTAGYHHKANALIALKRFAEAKTTLEAGMQAARRAGNVHAESEMRELLDTLPS